MGIYNCFWKEWKSILNQRVSNSQKAELLLGALDDLSLNAVLKQKRVGLDIESYLALKAFLEKRFISAETGCTARLNFRVITQQPNEKPEEYYTKLIGLAKDAYPTLAAETINELVLHKFCDGIADPTIRLKLLEHDPKNPDDAVSYCSKLLKLRNYAAALENNSNTTAKGTLNSAQLAETFRVGAVNANESNRSDSSRPKLYKSRFTSSGRPICNFCDEAGHIERNCWRKMIKMNPTSVIGMLTQKANHTIEVGIMTTDTRVVVEEKALAIEIEIGEIAAKTATIGSLVEIKQEAIVKIGKRVAIGIETIIAIAPIISMIVRNDITRIGENL
jgi:hypothetical protein